MSEFFTRKGDDGYTLILGAGRVPKYDPRLMATGAIDEANAALGLARALSVAPQTAAIVTQVQRHLYALMSEVAADLETAPRFRQIGAEQVAQVEAWTGQVSGMVELQHEFILPGDTVAGAAMDVARTVVRRAERELAALIHKGEVENVELLRYLNRLSSLCFALEILENAAGGQVRSTLAKGD